MRLSLLQTFNQGLRGMLNVQSKLYHTQNQLATGMRVNKPSDDPVAAAKILLLNDELSRLDQYKKNIDGAESSLALEESQLESITNLLTRVRELTIKAGSPGLTSTERSSITAEVRTRLDELAALANTRNTSGEYIFGGYKGEQAPFVASGSGYAYRGDDGVRMLQISSSTYVAMGHNGRQLFEAIPLATVPSSNGVLVARAAAVSTNAGTATVGNGQVTNAAQFASAFGAGASYRLEVSGYSAGPPETYDYDLFDRSGNNVTSVTGANSPISFGGADFAISGAAVPGDSFTLSAPTATISAGNITDVAAFRSTFTGPTTTFQISITGFTAPDQYSYDVLDGIGATVASGTYTDGETLTFGGAEFRIVGGAVGDTFQLSAPSSQSMLDTVARLANGLSVLGDSPDDMLRLQDLIAETLSNLENAEDNVGIVRAQVGARLNTLDSTREMHAGTELVSNEVMSEVRDLDYAEAITRLTLENTILQAAQQSFAKISQLSLFNFLR